MLDLIIRRVKLDWMVGSKKNYQVGCFSPSSAQHVVGSGWVR